MITIKILGTGGCANCKNLEKAVFNVAAELDITADITKIDDIQQAIAYGVMRLPGLVINEKLVLAGRIPNSAELKELISKYI